MKWRNLIFHGILMMVLVSLPWLRMEATSVEMINRIIEEEKTQPGNELTITLNVSILGNESALIIMEKLPKEFKILRSTPTYSKYNSTSNQIIWLFYRLTNVNNLTIKYLALIPSDVEEGSYSITGEWKTLISGKILSGITPSSEVKVEKLESRIELYLSTENIIVGESIKVSGTVFPKLDNLTISLTYVKPDGATISRTVFTAEEGVFSDSMKVDLPGNWQILAKWQGDQSYRQAKDQKAFMVEYRPENWLIFLIPIGVLSAVLTGLLILKRRRREK